MLKLVTQPNYGCCGRGVHNRETRPSRNSIQNELKGLPGYSQRSDLGASSAFQSSWIPFATQPRRAHPSTQRCRMRPAQHSSRRRRERKRHVELPIRNTTAGHRSTVDPDDPPIPSAFAAGLSTNSRNGSTAKKCGAMSSPPLMVVPGQSSSTWPRSRTTSRTRTGVAAHTFQTRSGNRLLCRRIRRRRDRRSDAGPPADANRRRAYRATTRQSATAESPGGPVAKRKLGSVARSCEATFGMEHHVVHSWLARWVREVQRHGIRLRLVRPIPHADRRHERGRSEL